METCANFLWLTWDLDTYLDLDPYCEQNMLYYTIREEERKKERKRKKISSSRIVLVWLISMIGYKKVQTPCYSHENSFIQENIII